MTQHVVFLQGMPCGFYRAIAERLNAAGVRTTGVSLCAGDRIFMPGPTQVHYRGTLSDWPAFIERLFVDTQVTDLVLLGEQRDYHKQAIVVAHRLGVRVTVTDFGYLRPDWITFEPNGMSGNSTLERDPERLKAIAADLPDVDLAPVYRDSYWHMALGDILVNYTTLLLFWWYPHYRSTIKRAHPLIYNSAMALRMLTARRRQRDSELRLDAFRARVQSYFLVPMQLEHDFQLLAYSPFEDGTEVIETIIASFARHAPAEMGLLFKCHPLDPGLRRWRPIIDETARRHGVEARVCYVDGGSLDAMIAEARGMVTVNSTSALPALIAACPVAVLGQAVYGIVGLVHTGALDGFWSAPQAPDPQLLSAFLKVLAHRHQIRGVFFNAPGVEDAADRAAAILRAIAVTAPLVAP